MSGKQNRRRRHDVTVALPARRVGRQASPKVLLGAAIVVVLAGVGVGMAVALGGGGKKAAVVAQRGSLVNALPGAADVHALFRGITQRENVLGSPKAPVTMVEYADMQCPYCREFDTESFPALVERYVRSGKVKVELRPLAFVGTDSVRGRNALIAAGGQGRMFDLMQILYGSQGRENTGWLSDALVQNAAASIPGLDVPQLLEASDGAAGQAVTFDTQAREDGVNSTPTIMVGKTGATLSIVKLATPSDTEGVTAAIESLLGRT
jgi:protein-disulfide isomerase